MANNTEAQKLYQLVLEMHPNDEFTTQAKAGLERLN
jgi:hypothetical protein